MIDRIIEKDINKSLEYSPIVGILGPRQVGKTTIAKKIMENYKNSIYLDCELPSDVSRLTNAEYYFKEHKEKLIIIDEVQNFPELFPLLRSLVDMDRNPARFIILGSSSPDLIKKSSESLAGRIIYHYLSGFSVLETGTDKKNLDKLWISGGFPNSFLINDEINSFKWRESFITNFLERDIPRFGLKISSKHLRRFWIMLAHSHGSLLNLSKIASAFGVSPPTISSYIDLLEKLFLIKRLTPFYANVKKRIIKSPKIYFRDSGLLHYLLGLKTKEDLLCHPILGLSWEGFVIEQIFSLLPENLGKYFYRTSNGNEIDLIITKGNNAVCGIEIKFSLSPNLTQGFWNAFTDLKPLKGFVIYPGEKSYPIDKNVWVISLNDLGKISEIFS